MVSFSPDSNNLAPVEHDPVHLSDEDGSHGLIKRCAVHVDGGTDWQHKTCHSLVDAKVLLQASERDRQGTSTVANQTERKASSSHRYHTGRFSLHISYPIWH